MLWKGHVLVAGDESTSIFNELLVQVRGDCWVWRSVPKP